MPPLGQAMKRFRVNTLMLLIVIVALGIALVVQDRRAARREAELRTRLIVLRENTERYVATIKALTQERKALMERSSVVEATGVKEGDSK
jgi:hypothetical protein